MNRTAVNILGMVAVGLGIAGTLLASFTSDKQLEYMVDEKVKEALEEKKEA